MKNQKGFGALETVIILALLGVIAFLGYRLTVAKRQASVNQEKAASNAELDRSPKAISSKVSAFYQLYTGNKPLGAGIRSIQQLEQDGFLTSEAAKNLSEAKGADPVLCTQGGSEQPLRFDDAVLNKDTASVKVRQYYDGQKSDNVIDVTLRLSDLKITDIKCNPSAD